MKLLCLAFQHNWSLIKRDKYHLSSGKSGILEAKCMCVSLMENPLPRIKSDSRNSFRLPNPQEQTQPCTLLCCFRIFIFLSHVVAHVLQWQHSCSLGLFWVRISSFTLDFFLFYFEMWDMLFPAHQKFWVS